MRFFYRFVNEKSKSVTKWIPCNFKEYVYLMGDNVNNFDEQVIFNIELGITEKFLTIYEE